MNDQMMPEEFWPTAWMQLAAWIEWGQPLLYCLLALIVVCLVLTLIDFAMLCWQEFHSDQVQETTKVRTKAAVVSEVEDTHSVARRLFSYL